MDTITHALSGALVARATARVHDGMTLGRRTWIGAAAAAFPDIDFGLRWIDSITYLNWHRGPTHSFVLLPLFALLLAATLHFFYRDRPPFRPLVLLCALGIAVHIAGDVITVYGTRILYPLSDLRATLSTTFIIDLIFTGIIVTGLLLSRFWKPRFSAAMATAVLASYVGTQAYWHHEARAIADNFAQQRGLNGYAAFALPQPLSPLNWKLVVTNGDTYYQTYIRLHGTSSAWLDNARLADIAGNYRRPADLHWSRIARFGDTFPDARLARQVWEHKEFAGFRNFAVFPVLLRIDNHGPETCVWFTDLRFVVGDLTAPFRYGLCGHSEADRWNLERLRDTPIRGRDV